MNTATLPAPSGERTPGGLARGPQRPWSTAERARLVLWVSAGFTVRETARELNRTPSAVTQQLHEMKLTSRALKSEGVPS